MDTPPINELEQLVATLTGKSGYVTQIFLIMGLMRAVLKWFSNGLVSHMTDALLRICKSSPEASRRVFAVLESRWYSLANFFIDMVLSAKFPLANELQLKLTDSKDKI